MDWMGVIVEDGLKDVSVLDHVGIVEKRFKELGVSGNWTVLEVSVNEGDFDKVVNKLKRGLRPAWYAYFTRKDRQVIVFKGKKFNIKKGSKKSLAHVKNWAFKKYNLLPDNFTLNL